VFVAAAAGNGDLEPMRALPTHVAGGTVGVDRSVDALDDLHKLQHAIAWTRIGLTFGTDEDGPHTADVISRIGTVRRYLDTMPTRATTPDQPAKHRWRGVAASLHPELALTEDWPQFAAELDWAVNAGIDVAGELHRIVSDLRHVATPAPPPAPIAGRRQPKRPPQPTPTAATPPPHELAAASYRQPPPPDARADPAQLTSASRRRSMEGSRLISRPIPRTLGTPPPSCTNAAANSGAAPRAAANRSAANSLRRAT
jgi:hypothetical protein